MHPVSPHHTPSHQSLNASSPSAGSHLTRQPPEQGAAPPPGSSSSVASAKAVDAETDRRPREALEPPPPPPSRVPSMATALQAGQSNRSARQRRTLLLYRASSQGPLSRYPHPRTSPPSPPPTAVSSSAGASPLTRADVLTPATEGLHTPTAPRHSSVPHHVHHHTHPLLTHRESSTFAPEAPQASSKGSLSGSLRSPLTAMPLYQHPHTLPPSHAHQQGPNALLTTLGRAHTEDISAYRTGHTASCTTPVGCRAQFQHHHHHHQLYHHHHPRAPASGPTASQQQSQPPPPCVMADDGGSEGGRHAYAPGRVDTTAPVAPHRRSPYAPSWQRAGQSASAPVSPQAAYHPLSCPSCATAGRSSRTAMDPSQQASSAGVTSTHAAYGAMTEWKDGNLSLHSTPDPRAGRPWVPPTGPFLSAPASGLRAAGMVRHYIPPPSSVPPAPPLPPRSYAPADPHHDMPSRVAGNPPVPRAEPTRSDYAPPLPLPLNLSDVAQPAPPQERSPALPADGEETASHLSLYITGLPPSIQNAFQLGPYVPPEGRTALRVKRVNGRDVAFAEYDSPASAAAALEWFYAAQVLRDIVFSTDDYMQTREASFTTPSGGAHSPYTPPQAASPVYSSVPAPGLLGPLALPTTALPAPNPAVSLSDASLSFYGAPAPWDVYPLPYHNLQDGKRDPVRHARQMRECCVLNAEWSRGTSTRRPPPPPPPPPPSAPLSSAAATAAAVTVSPTHAIFPGSVYRDPNTPNVLPPPPCEEVSLMWLPSSSQGAAPCPSAATNVAAAAAHPRGYVCAPRSPSYRGGAQACAATPIETHFAAGPAGAMPERGMRVPVQGERGDEAREAVADSEEDNHIEVAATAAAQGCTLFVKLQRNFLQYLPRFEDQESSSTTTTTTTAVGTANEKEDRPSAPASSLPATDPATSSPTSPATDADYQFARTVLCESYFQEHFGGIRKYSNFMRPPFCGGCFVCFERPEDAIACLREMRGNRQIKRLFKIQFARQESTPPGDIH